MELGFPAGEGVAVGGWDGTARTVEPTAHVPQGLSLWELSVERAVGAKADRDYAKRASTPDGRATNDCTYVAVSLRRWAKRTEWAIRRRGDGMWRDVRAYGVDDLEQWLETAPVTHAWLSELLGFRPHGLVPIETWWSGWSTATEPSLPPEAVLAGRTREAEALRAELNKPGQIITISAPGREDVAAFVAAVAALDGSHDGGALAARTALVDGVETWRRLGAHSHPLVLLPWAGDVLGEVRPGLPHHVIVPITDAARADITLSAIDPGQMEAPLVGVGVDEDVAREVARIARMSIVAARRRIAVRPELHRPSWARPPVDRTVRRAVLAGRWSENAPGDRDIVERLFGSAYDDLREQCAALAAGADPLLSRAGSSLALVSHADAWLLLMDQLSKDDLDRFRDSALAVLTLPDPTRELPPGERWRASMEGKVRAHSGDLRSGLASTLALLGAHGQAAVAGSGLTGADWASWIVKEILDRANEDGSIRAWASLDDVLTLLAEAAPSAFLEAVRKGLAGDTPILKDIFMDQDAGSALFADSPHTELLWALEVCAWSPDHFGQVVDLLARLAEIDPGGRFANRPAKSLQEIFCPWHPQNSVSQSRRLAALDGLRQRHNNVASKLMVSMLPDLHGVATPTAVPRYRDWRPPEAPVARADYWDLVDEVSGRLLEDAGGDVTRWGTMIDELANLPGPRRSQTIEGLGRLAEEDMTEADRLQLWESLRSTIARHREFSSAAWALPEDEVSRLEAAAAGFAPPAPGDRLKWLFEEHLPDIPDTAPREDFEAYSAALADLRANAAREIAEALDWRDLRDYAAALKNPWFFGTALAQAGVMALVDEALELLHSENHSEREFALSYFAQRFQVGGWPWLEPLLNREELSAGQRARLLLLSNDYPTAWERAAGCGAEVEAEFWRRFRVVGLGHGFQHVESVAGKLLKARRPRTALDLLVLYSRKDTSDRRAELMAEALDLLLTDTADEEADRSLLSGHEFKEVFTYLERSGLDRERLARLEWAYLPVFEFEKSPQTLSRYLAEDPSFFVDVVCRVYRPRLVPESEEETEEEVRPEPDEPEQATAENAYRLLSEWRTLPGLLHDGLLDPERLNSWVDAARAALRDERRLEIGDEHIGRVLASSPQDADEAWPARPVRDLLERVQSPHLEDGLRTQILNSRGVTSRDPLAGGDQERHLAEHYRGLAAQFDDRWPRTAAVLRQVAESYDRGARREDEDAERLRRGLDR